MTPDSLEQNILLMNNNDLIKYLMEKNLLLKEKKCLKCDIFMKYSKYTRNIDAFAWRCINKHCIDHLKYISIRIGSFFYDFNISLKYILRVIIKYSCKNQRYMINLNLDIGEKTIRLILKKLVSKIPFTSYENDKLGGPLSIVQIDETMLNYKCKSHRGRSAENKTDALCIVEKNEQISRVFACIIENKKSETIDPIIINQVANGSTIWTDEHRSYQCLNKYSYIHGTVCHKYRFITDEGINTQAVESFNNCIKYEIKNR